MLVKKVAFNRFFLAVSLLLSVSFSAFADQTTCEATEVFYNGVAQKAISALEAMSAKTAEYNNHIQSAVKDTSAPCYLLNMYIEPNTSSPYTWSGFDSNGAAQAGSYASRIQSLISGIDLSNIDIDFAPYEYKNSGRIAATNVALKLPNADKTKLENDLRIYLQCKAEIFNLQQEQSSVKSLRDDASMYLRTLSSPQGTTCSCDESGTLKSCRTISSTPEEIAQNDMSCKNLNEFAQSSAFCPTCAVFERILMADQKLAKGAFGALSGGLIKILSIAFLIYLAFQTLTLVSSPANQPISKYLTGVTIQAFKVLVAVFILSNPSFIYNLALKPIIEGGIDFGITLTASNQAAIMEAGTKYTKFDTTDSLLSAPFLQKMIGAADAFNTQAAIMPAMGQALVCNAFTNLDWNVIPNIATMIEGFLVVVFGYMISFSVGFYLLDLTLELGFLCCLLPFLVACWPFRLTKNYVNVGWNIFMHVFFNFVMLGVVITTINEISKRVIAPSGDIGELVNALNENNIEKLKKIMDLGGSSILMLIIGCYICLKLLKDINNLANKFAAGAGFNVSPNLGGFATSGALAIGASGGHLALRGASAIGRGASAIGRESGATGALKAGGDAVSNALGFTKIKNYATEKQAQGKQLLNNALGNLGIGANAIERGGRQDNTASTASNGKNTPENSNTGAQS